MQRVSQVLSRLPVVSNDPKSVASGGLMLPMSLAQQLDVEARFDRRLPPRGLGRRHNAGAKALTMVSLLLAGGEFITDVEMLGSGATSRVLGHDVYSPSRCGEWLRSLTGSDADEMSRVNKDLVATAWHAGLGPGLGTGYVGEDCDRLVLDIDSTVIQTYGSLKEGASKRNYRGVRGYHPLILAEASTGQVLAGRMRDENATPAKDAAVFIDAPFSHMTETLPGSSETVLRGDSGFYTKGVIDTCIAHNVRFSITIRQHAPVRDLIATIDQDRYETTPSTAIQQFAVTKVPYTVKGRTGKDPVACRLIMRRTTVPADTGEPQARLFDLVEYRAFVTDLDGDAKDLDRFHRQHTVIEAVIQDLRCL
jgi:Transposase DDE domain group 1